MSQPDDLRHILFVELLGGIGDVLIALPAIQALSRSYPKAQLSVFTFAPGSELLQSDPLIHSVTAADRNHPRQALVTFLENNTFDLIVSDTNYDGIDQLIEHRAPQTVTNLWRSPPADQFVGDRFEQILLAEGLIQPDAILPPQLHLTRLEAQRAQQAVAGMTHPLVCLVPDAGMAVKRWAIANFIAFGQALERDYAASVIVPIGNDHRQAMQIARGIGDAAHLWPRSSLRHLAAGLACADLVVAADTGVARIAAALAVPTITLFGPSWYGRYGQASPHVNLQGYPECPERVIANFTEQRCWYEVCPFEQWQTCLEDISVADVLRAAAPFARSYEYPAID